MQRKAATALRCRTAVTALFRHLPQVALETRMPAICTGHGEATWASECFPVRPRSMRDVKCESDFTQHPSPPIKQGTLDGGPFRRFICDAGRIQSGVMLADALMQRR